MWTLSGFVDEISDDLDEQLEVASGLGLRYAEVRSAWGTNILDLDDAQIDTMQASLARHAMQVSSIGSPIGKIFVDEDFEAHLVRVKRAADVAHRLDAPYIRIFSFFIRPGENPDDHRDEVLRRMRAIADVAEAADVILLHENEKEIYGDVPRRCVDIIESVGSGHLRAAWDAANFVQVGVKRPFDEGYPLLRPHLEYMQIKDARSADGSVTVAGDGDGQLLETIRALRQDGFDGFLSMEPHLADSHAFGGHSGPELFGRATTAFTDLLASEGITYA